MPNAALAKAQLVELPAGDHAVLAGRQLTDPEVIRASVTWWTYFDRQVTLVVLGLGHPRMIGRDAALVGRSLRRVCDRRVTKLGR